MLGFIRFMLQIASIIFGMGVTITVMIFGWGLTPKSWPIITVGYLFGMIFALMFSVIASELAKYTEKENGKER